MSDNRGFPYHSMSKLYQNNSKTSMAIPHLFCMDEIHVLQRICLQVFKKIVLLLYLGVSHLNPNFVITGGSGGCRYDNLLSHQWWQSWDHDNTWFWWHFLLPVILICIMFKTNVMNNGVMWLHLHRCTPACCWRLVEMHVFRPQWCPFL